MNKTKAQAFLKCKKVAKTCLYWGLYTLLFATVLMKVSVIPQRSYKMDLMLELFCFQGQGGTFNLRFQANVDEKSFKCSEKWKCKHLQFYSQLRKLPALIVCRVESSRTATRKDIIVRLFWRVLMLYYSLMVSIL